MITLNNTNFEEEVLKHLQLVLVEFYTEWSGAHHIISPGLTELKALYELRVKFCMIDVGNHKALSEKYGIWNVPTIVFFKNGHPMDYIVGLAPKRVIAQKLDFLLEP